MNLDVTVRLIDQLSRPGRDATAALEKMGATASRLAARFSPLTSGLRGLTSAARELTAAERGLGSATASTTRLRGTMASLGNAGRTAASGLAPATRAIDRLGTSASRAANAASRLHDGLARSVADSFVDRTNAALREQVKLLGDAARLSNRLGNAGGGNGRGGRRGLGGGGGHMPGVLMAFQPDMHALRGIYEQATSLQDAIIRMHGMGLSDAEIARVRSRADEVAKANKSTTPLRVMNSVMEARTATGGNLDESIRLAPELANAEQVLTRFLPAEAAKRAHEQLYDMVRAGELRNEIGDPAKLHRMFESMLATSVYTQGRVGPRDQHKNILYGRGASQGWSDDFANDRLPFFVQELKTGPNGGQAGVALQSLFKNVALGVRSKKANAEWARIGMMGADGEIVGANEGISDPDRFLARVHRAMSKAGITGHEDQVKEYGKLFGTGTGQTAAMIGGFQQDRLAAYNRSRKTVADSQGLVDLANQTLSQSSDNLKASFETLEGNVGSVLTPLMTSLADAATGAIRGLNSIVSPFGKNGSDPAGNTAGSSGAAMLGAGSAAAGALLGTGWLFRKFPFLGKVAAGGAGWAATQSPAGVALGPTIESGIRGLMSKLPAAAEAGLVAGLKSGFKYGGLLALGEFAIDKIISTLPKPTMSPEKQAAFDKHQSRWNNAWIWQKPGLIWQDAFGEHETTAEVAGKRARGGPVRGGLTYLVGERGPELFTPGVSGGITTNSFMGRMSAGSGDGGETPRAIRYLSFELVSAVDGISRSLDRLGRGRIIGATEAPGTGAGGTGTGESGSGTGSTISGGRRGFMARDGHFGGRRGFMARGGTGGAEVVPGGPHVGPVSARGVMRGRGMTASKIASATESYNFWRGKGATHAQAAAMVSNEETESGFNPRSIGDGGSAHGIMQWHGDRRRKIMRGTGINIDQATHLQQLEASYWEMTKGAEREGGRRFFGARNEHEATDALVNFYERPADRAGNVRGRTAGALKWGAWFPANGPALADKAGTPAPAVPDFLAERARRKGERDRALAAPQAKAGAGSGAGAAMQVGTVHVHVAAQPHHDTKQIAAAVHQRFNDAVHSQLNDGAFG